MIEIDEEIAKIDAALVEIRSRQEKQPRNAVQRRMRLAMLIMAFERRRDLWLAKRDKEETCGMDDDAVARAGASAGDSWRDAGLSS